MTLPPPQVERPRSTIQGWTRVLWTVLALRSSILLTASASARRRMDACRVRLMSTIRSWRALICCSTLSASFINALYRCTLAQSPPSSSSMRAVLTHDAPGYLLSRMKVSAWE